MITLDYLGKMGQLGNQMFQYAALKGIANHKGYDYGIPNHSEVFDDGIGNRLRIELFECFDLDVPTFNARQSQVVQESGFEFDENLFNNCPDSVSLAGYFQTDRYFDHIADEIREDFIFKKSIRDECQPIVDEVLDEKPIALHIRRGDFLINSGNHHNLGLDYYEEALSKFDSDREVAIFSDDPFWVASQELFKPDRFLLSETGRSHHDLYLMTQCSDFIIANSTFSWWGAWLANKGRVIAPSTWFGPNNAHLNIKDLYCNHWEICNG